MTASGCGSTTAADTTSSTTTGSTATDTASSTSSASAGTTTGTTTTGTTGNDDPCVLLPDPGPCEADFPRWFFNQDTMRCEQFSWGGCEGTVPFEDRIACEQTCEPCDAFDAQDIPAQEIAFSIRNARAEPVFLDVARQSDDDPLYFFEQHYDLDVFGEPIRPRVGFCENEFSCAGVNDELCGGCDPGPPQNPPAPVEIAPMSSFAAMGWSGFVWRDTVRPLRCISQQCQSQGLQDTPCHRLAGVAGDVTATARAFAGAVDGPAIEAKTTFFVNEASDVEIVFE